MQRLGTSDDSMPMFDVFDVLLRADDERDRFAGLVGESVDGLDALLVSDVLRASGRVGETLALRHQVTRMCAIVRALDAAERDLIDATELRTGLHLAATTTDRFEDFGAARVLLRTLLELLDREPAPQLSPPLRAQVALLHAEVRRFVLEQLTGSPSGALAARAPSPAATSPLDPWTVADRRTKLEFHGLVDELLHGADHHPVTGVLGAAWMRDWAAVPLTGDQLAEDDPDEVDRLLTALQGLARTPTALVLATVRRRPAWRLDGSVLHACDGLRRSWQLPPSRVALHATAATRSESCVLTTPHLDFAVVEGTGHHALIGPASFVETACGVPALEAVAAFREHAEDVAPELIPVANSYGRLRRRSR